MRNDTLRLCMPAQLRVACNGVIDTLGRVTFDGRVPHPFTAHPKHDPVTGARAPPFRTSSQWLDTP